MTPQQALELLDKATAQLNLPRQAHGQVIQALDVLKKTINPPTPVPNKKDKKK